MRVKYLVAICLVLVLAAVPVAGPGCKKEPKPVIEDLGPNMSAAGPQGPSAGGSAAEAATRIPTVAAITAAKAASASMPADQNESEYLAVFMEGKKVGYAVQTRCQAGGKVTTSEEVSITMSRAGVPITVKMTETSIETPDGKPLGFETRQLLGAMEMKVAGTVEPNGVISLTQSAMGAEQKSTLEWPSGAVMAEGLRLLEREKGMKEGVQYSVKVFSAGIMQALDAQIHIGAKQDVNLLGRVVRLTEVTTTMNMPGAGEIVSTGYVDDDLRIQKNLVPVAGMLIEMVACAKEFALGQNDVFEVINRLFLASPAPLGNPDAASAITYTLSPTDGTDFNIPSTDNQQVEKLQDGKVVVTVKPVSSPVGGTFPYRGKDPTILDAMKPNRFLQSDDKQIIKLAQGAVGGTKDAGEAAKRIEAFVAEYIENKDLSVGYASAAEVAASKQGDCSEHAVLTAAMCRAVGIPARIVTGVAYVDDWSGLQGFGGHAWVQAFIGRNTGKWVGLDAAFKGTGRGGYGPGHIALAVGNGEPGDFFNLATTLGKFKIDKAEVKK